MKPTTCFRYRYKTIAEINKLNAEELVTYKKQMLSQSESLLAEASEWKYTYKHLLSYMNDVCLNMEIELEAAALDRMQSDDSDYGSIGFIH